jgi:hypothetical protein
VKRDLGFVLLYAALAVAFAGMLVWGFSLRAALSSEKAGRATDRAEWSQKVAVEERKARNTEALRQAAVDDSREKLNEAARKIDKRDAVIAGLRVDTRGLRGQLAAFAAGDGSADTIPACQARAEALGKSTARSGELLVEAQELLRRIAKAHDQFAEEVTELVTRWQGMATGRSTTNPL